MKQYRPDTTCIHAGYTPGNGEPRVLPIVQSTTYTYDSSKEMGDLFDLKADGFFYTRLGNPTLDAVEKKLAALEGGVGALVTSSGQAATMMAVLNICHAGGERRIPREHPLRVCGNAYEPVSRRDRPRNVCKRRTRARRTVHRR